MRTAHEFQGIEPDVVAYTAVIDACAKGGRLERPAHKSSQSKERSRDSEGVPDPAETMWENTRATTGPERALELMEQMQEEGQILNMLHRLYMF